MTRVLLKLDALAGILEIDTDAQHFNEAAEKASQLLVTL